MSQGQSTITSSLHMAKSASSVAKALQDTHEVIKQILAAGGTAGASVAVSENGTCIHEAYYGYKDIASGAKPDRNTIYGIASITKSFSAAAIGILVHERKLDWFTPLRTILPELDSSDPIVTKQLTITELLTHQTGLTNSNEWWYGADGEILVGPEQEMQYFNTLRSVHPFRTKFLYSNWGYGVVGKVIERLSGSSYSTFLQERIFEPLGLRDTTLEGSRFESSEYLATPYAALDDHTSYELPQPKVRAGTILAAAQGIRSTPSDLLKWGSALLQAAAYEEAHGSQPLPGSPLRYASKQLSKHVERKQGDFEKSYALGFYRNQLPTTFEGLGCNSMFVAEMPTIASKEGHPVIISHGGSMAGYHTFLVLIPDMKVVIAVMTNSIALADPAGWTTQYLIETIVDSPSKNDWVKFAQQAAQKHIESYPQIFKELEMQRSSNRPAKNRDVYVGTYKDAARPFYIQIREGSTSPLEVLFQGRESQMWPLNHYEADTFVFLSTRDEQARRALFTFAGTEDFKIIFEPGEDDEIGSLLWPMDPNLSNYVQRFWKAGHEVDLVDKGDGVLFTRGSL